MIHPHYVYPFDERKEHQLIKNVDALSVPLVYHRIEQAIRLWLKKYQNLWATFLINWYREVLILLNSIVPVILF